MDAGWNNSCHHGPGGKCFLPVIRFYSNYFILIFFFNTYVLFKIGAVEIYADDDGDNEAQHLHDQSNFHIQTLC